MPALDSHFGGAAFNTYANARALSAYSTDTTNEVVCVFLTMKPETGSTPPTVTSITDGAGLTWTKRFRGTNGTNNFELWYAPTSAKLVSDVISVFFDQSCIGSICVFAVTGLASINDPFDGNASVPGFTNPGSGTTAATPPVSTNQARTLIVALAGVFGDATSAAIGAPFAINENNSGTFGSALVASVVENQQVITLQAVFTVGGNSDLGILTDAFKGPGWLRADFFVGGG